MEELDRRLQGSRSSLYFRELFTNTAHFPLVNILVELLVNDPAEYLLELDFYALLVAMLVQAWLLSGWQQQGTPRPLVGNLIGPLLYTLVEVAMEGNGFFTAPNHVAYWCFALSIGLFQQLQLLLPTRPALLILAEGMVRTSIPLVMYIVLEFELDEYTSVGGFLEDAPHLFIALIIPFLGLIVGFANVNLQQTLHVLRATAQQLRQYSEWLLGRELLSQAVEDPRSLTLSRHERGLLFTDIRGFTAWSEGREPEEVVAMINDYYEAAEPVWREMQAIKVKLTADEIMLVFANATLAARAAYELHRAIDPLLQAHGLSAGSGVHAGAVVEGLMGGHERKSYDLLGDSVNTAKRLCDKAAGGEILVSREASAQIECELALGTPREVSVKGKAEPIPVLPLLAITVEA